MGKLISSYQLSWFFYTQVMVYNEDITNISNMNHAKENRWQEK